LFWLPLGLLWAVLCLAWAIWLLRPARRSILLPPWRRRAVPWTGWEFLFAWLAVLVWPAFVVELLGASGFFGWLYGPDFQAAFVERKLKGLDTARVLLWASDLALPLTLASILVVFFALSGTRPYQLGLTASRFGRNLLLGVTTTVCVVPVVYLILYLVNWLLRLGIGEAPEPHVIERLILSHPPPVDYVASGLGALVIAPIMEELLFRGITQPWIRVRSWGGYAGIAGALCLALERRWSGLTAAWAASDWGGTWPQLLPAAFVVVMVPGYLLVRAKAPPAAGAVYATALLFAAAHSAVWPTPVPLFFFALALGALRYRTQSLVPSVTAHALFNAVSWVLLLQPLPPPEKGKEATDARVRVAPISTSSAVPGSALPRRT
jgi:membrane protease YdiL (CAAX protease family)